MDSGLRIAMIGHKRIPSREGGVEIVVEELASRMVERGCKVTAYNRSGHHVAGKDIVDEHATNGRDYKGIRLVTVPTPQKKSLNAVIYAFFATVRASFGKYDVVHLHAEGPAFMSFIPKLFGKKVVVTIHGLDWQRAKWGGFGSWFLKAGEKMAVRKADAIITLSGNMQKYFQDTYGRETICLPNGVNQPESRTCHIITQKYGLMGDDYILFLARLVPEKGLEYLLDAYDNLVLQGSPIGQKKLIIAGGSSHTDQYMERISEKVASLNHKYLYRYHLMKKKEKSKDKDKNIDMVSGQHPKKIIMTGFVQGEELQELYSNASLYVLPSDVEGMPLSLLEALSYGNTCLVSNIPENLEVVGQDAYSFEKGNVQDLMKKLVEIFDHEPGNRKEIQRHIMEKYNWDDITGRTLQLYHDLINDSGVKN